MRAATARQIQKSKSQTTFVTDLCHRFEITPKGGREGEEEDEDDDGKPPVLVREDPVAREDPPNVISVRLFSDVENILFR